MDGIGLVNPHSNEQWERLVTELVARAPFADQSVYLQVTRGVAKRDHAFPKDVPATVFMMSSPLATPSAEQVERGVAVVTADDNRWRRCDLKTISLVGNVLMRQLAADAGAVETVMFRDGRLTEASASNVLIVVRGTIVAPPKDALILPGITYDAALEFAREAGMPFEVRPVARPRRSPPTRCGCPRRPEVLAVTTVDGRPFGGRARPGVPPDARRVPAAQAEMAAKLTLRTFGVGQRVSSRSARGGTRARCRCGARNARPRR
jgi:D-alanine transaminase